MIKKIFYFLTFAFIVSCSNLKNTHKHLSSGNYDAAINNSIAYLQKNRTGRKTSKYHKLLSQSYKKAVERDHKSIAFLKADANPEGLENLYETYINLEKRQAKIQPLLPIEGYTFKTENYTQEILSSRNKLSEYLYAKATNKLNTNNKQLAKEAHEDFSYIQNINPNYKDVPVLLNSSREKGTDYVFVSLQNNTEYIIPRRLRNNLLNIDQQRLNNYWTVHHTNKLPHIKYDYTLNLSFDRIYISPEQMNQVHILQEKEVINGKKKLLDKNGNVKRDKEGRVIKVDDYVTVKSNVHQFTQFKECTILANAIVKDNNTQQIITTQPYRSNFVFEHVYATQTGDRRALTNRYLNMLGLQQVNFPTNEQMILDAGNDIKNRLTKQLTGLKF